MRGWIEEALIALGSGFVWVGAKVIGCAKWMVANDLNGRKSGKRSDGNGR